MDISRPALRVLLLVVLTSGGTAIGRGAELELPPARAGLDNAEPPHRSVYSVLEDRDGFLWIGTLDGLGRYDGYEMAVFRHDPGDPTSLSDNAVHVLLEDARGTLWVGTEQGLDSLDRHTGLFTHHPAPGLESPGGLIITCGFEDRRGGLWFGTSRGLLRLQPGASRFDVFTHAPDDPSGLTQSAIVALDEDSTGQLWVATASEHDFTVHRVDEPGPSFSRVEVDSTREWSIAFVIDVDDRAWIHPSRPFLLDDGRFDGEARVPEGSCSVSRTAVEAPDGTIWIGCDDGLYRIDRGDGSVRRVPLRSGDSDYLGHYVRALTVGRSGVLWVGTQAGIFRFDPAAKPFAHHGHDPDRPDSLAADSVSALVETADGDLWVGTFGGGLNRLDGTLESARRYCVGTSRTEACFGTVIWDLHLDRRGVLWIAADGIWSLDKDRDRPERHLADADLPAAGFAFIAESPPGTLWLAGFDRRLYRFDTDEERVEAIDVSGEATLEWVDPRIDSLLVQDHLLWLGTGSWLGVYDISSGTLERVALERPGGEFLGSQGTWTIHPGGQGGLWLGTANGLLAYRPDTGELSAWTTRNGLPGSAVYSILEDNQGRLWLGTNQGLSRFDAGAPVGARFRTYTNADGIGNVEFNRHAALELSDGRFVFGGMDGLTVFEPTRIRDNTFVPPVHVTRAEIWSRDGKRTIAAGGLDRLELSHRDSTFGFTFAALSFTDPESNRYAYRLEGYDEEWVDAGTRRTCQYTNLPPGDYVFRVVGSNNDGLWNELGDELPVIIRPAVWQTRWFRLLMTVAVGAAIWSAMAYRRSRRREMERLRLRIADDLHDDLSSDLSGIAVVTDMVQRKPGIDPNDRRDLAAVRDVALKMVDGVRDIVWYIDPEHDNLEATVIRMRQVADILLRGLQHRFDVDLRDRAAALPMIVRRNLLMIFKESLHNIVRHADADDVHLVLVVERHRLRFTVADNGRGFDIATEPDDRHGLRGMRRRADEIGARLEVGSSTGFGTTVSLVVDLTRTRYRRSPSPRPTLKNGDRGDQT